MKRDEPGRGGLFSEEYSGIDFRAQLNDNQYEAVTHGDGPVLVVAGAGSGKTRTLVYRVAWLVERGVPPEAVLLLTFTRKAAAEMLARAEALVGRRCVRVSGGTFHSLAHELLRRHAGRVGFPDSFGILDRGDMEEILGHLRKAAGLGEKDRRFPKRGTLATILSKAVNKGASVEELVEREYIHLAEYMKDILRLAGDYAAYKREGALMDFDDLLATFARLLEQDVEARDLIASAYRYILVDEYQDTNHLQAEIVRRLGRGHGNVMAVGDDAQAIYSFRGASFKNIMEFPQTFPGTRLIRLEENYRSRQPILNLTNHIISRTRDRYEKRLFTRREGEDRPRLLITASQKEQSLLVCEKIRELLDQGIRLDEMAVLFRAASHSFDLEVELGRNGFEYVKYGGRRFLEAAHIKDLLACLRCLANPRDAISLTRVLLLMEGVGPKGAADILAWLDGRRERLMNLDDFPARGKVRASLERLAGFFRQAGQAGTPFDRRVQTAWDFYLPIMEGRFDDHPARKSDIGELLRLAEGYSGLNRFLADMTLEPPNASMSGNTGTRHSDRLTLSTVHSAKGLEWRAVFIIGLAEGRFPPPYALNSQAELDEERRLLYVAATRAEDHLYLICPLEEGGYRGGRGRPQVSRFLADVPPNLLSFRREEEPSGAVFPPRSAPAPQPPGDPAARTPNGLSPGARVSHPVFGLGRVVGMKGEKKIEIDFDHFGHKTLHLDYAGLKSSG